MRGIVLAGGLGTRLNSLTKITNKHLLPIFDQPMIFYPLKTLIEAEIDEIQIIVSGPFAGNFLPLLQNGKELGIKHLEYAYQTKPDGGIADALKLAENFAHDQPITVILGDNLFDQKFSKEDLTILNGCKIFLKHVNNPNSFGVPTIQNDKIVEMIEKPEIAKSNYAITGLYCFDSKVFDYIKNCQPSSRQQLEIVDVLNQYLLEQKLEYKILESTWFDAGTPINLTKASNYYLNNFLKENHE